MGANQKVKIELDIGKTNIEMKKATKGFRLDIVKKAIGEFDIEFPFLLPKFGEENAD